MKYYLKIIALVLLFLSCKSKNEIVQLELYSVPSSYHVRFTITEETIKTMESSEKSIITDSIIINKIFKELNKLEYSKNDYEFFDIRKLCEIKYKDGTTDALIINDMGDVKYNEKVYKGTSFFLSLFNL